jgi:probable F420-dependent oxidoreductase
MRFGITMFATDQAMDPIELARSAEDRGFDSIYLPEHTHSPISRRTPPPTGDDELADEYKHTLDPLVTLAACAAVTERIRLGTGIALPAQREPIVTAKAIATLDHLSTGRFVFGIGFGWNADELEDHGVSMSDRRAVCREHVLAMQALWADDVAGFDGDHVHISPSWSWPKPKQRPGPPVLLGGVGGPKLFAHIAEYGHGWIPIGGSGMTKSVPELRRVYEAAGRDPDALEIIPFGTIPDAGKLEHYADLGVTECVLRVPIGGRDDVLPVLDQLADLVQAL